MGSIPIVRPSDITTICVFVLICVYLRLKQTIRSRFGAGFYRLFVPRSNSGKLAPTKFIGLKSLRLSPSR
ncbi:MAG: hypothetical protein ACRCT1_20605 [Microcoleaceae cyanobacterium]